MKPYRYGKKYEYQYRRTGCRNGEINENTENNDFQFNDRQFGASSSQNFEYNDVIASENEGDVNFHAFRNPQSYSASNRGKHPFSSRNSNYIKKSFKDYSMYSTNSNFLNQNQVSASPDFSSTDLPNSSEASQRGKVVSGRYIRQRTNQTSAKRISSNDSNSKKAVPKENFPDYSRNPLNCENLPVVQNKKKINYNSMAEGQKGNNGANSYHRDKQYHNKFSNSRQLSFPAQNIETKEASPNLYFSNLDKYDNRRSNIQKNKMFDSKQTYRTKSYASASYSSQDKATQRELLIHRLHNGECECLVCCEFIKTKDPTWHCLSCYHVFHLRCIKKWARSPAAAVEDGSWRCPACQTLSNKVPFDYFCFCGKNKNPEINYHLTPHSCGDNCNRSRHECSHPCKELCHPGPCPPCAVVVQKTCPCRKTRKNLPCSQNVEGNCEEICDKVLNCGLHRCHGICHESACSPCEKTVLQKCYCQKGEKVVECTSETSSCSVYSCDQLCGKELSCGNHTCQLICHPGACDPCKLSTSELRTCACGKNNLIELIRSGQAQERLSCLDPVPTCGQVCEKELHCGPEDNVHMCRSPCHVGGCPKCPLMTSFKCSCGAFTREFPCAEITESFIYTCEKRCNRRKDCGRHKCLNKCCTNFDHKCELVCNKKLSCGLHQCQETCHAGNCPTCWNVSFDELHCYCGETVLFPPIHCGTKPPECSKPCTRNHPCEHDVKHSCHSEETCPPCTSLTAKWCYGNHKKCGPVACFLDGVSCGMPCQKPLPCGRHSCKLSCHAGPCGKDVDKCLQPCTSLRDACGHTCGAPCHEGPCPETQCKSQVTLNCPCGHRSETTSCYESTKSYRLLSSTILATKLQEIKEGQSVNLNEVLGKKSKSNKLQCNEECAILERNKRLAVALQIQNPDLSCSPGSPTYSEFLKDEAKKSPIFVSDVYDKISNLVQLAKQSKQKCRSHSFPPMNRDHRRVVHELADFFGCETQSYDEEPKKNVVVTAYKNKCWLPFVSIMSVVQRDMGIRKGPAPVLTQVKNSVGTSVVLNQKKKIDYFDYND